MENKDVGWCRHIQGHGFYRITGGTAVKIECGESVVMFWPDQNTMFVYCWSCYTKEFPSGGKLPNLNKRLSERV